MSTDHEVPRVGSVAELLAAVGAPQPDPERVAERRQQLAERAATRVQRHGAMFAQLGLPRPA